MSKHLFVTMPDESVWAVPVSIIATHRATYYAGECGGDVEKSLAEDTMPLFEHDPFEVEDWAANNMNWSDVVEHARLVSEGETDYEDGWVNGEKEVKDL